jgi:hypothetical protein
VTSGCVASIPYFIKIGQLIQKCNLETQRHADIMVMSRSFFFPFREIIIYYLFILFYFILFLLWRCDPTQVMASSFLTFLDHTQRRTTVGRTPWTSDQLVA